MRITAYLPFLQFGLAACAPAMAQKFTTLAYIQVTEDAPIHRAIEVLKKIDGITSIYFGRRVEDNKIVDLAIGKSSHPPPIS